MAKSVHLTKRTIDALKYVGGTDYRWDRDLKGFGVRVFSSGRKNFVIAYRHAGRKRIMTLGPYGALTLEDARTKARRELGKVADGKDPLAEKRKAAQGQTFGDLEREYLARHAKLHKKTWRTDEGRLTRHVPRGWRSRMVSTITREEVAAMHRAIGATRPYEANRTLDLLRVMFRLAKLWYFLDPSADNPAEGVQKYREQKRKRWLTPHELPWIAKAIDGEANVYVRAVLWLYLLTGARKNELLRVRWDDVNWEGGRLRLTDTKAGEEQDLVLSGAAAAILRAIPRLPDNPFIFPSAKTARHLVNIDKPWRRIRKRATLGLWKEDEDSPAAALVARLEAELEEEPTYDQCVKAACDAKIDLPTGLADIRIHDLRRSAGSWLAAAGVDLTRIRDALRHANIATTLTYARLGADATRDAMEEHGQRVMAAAARRLPGEIVTLTRERERKPARLTG